MQDGPFFFLLELMESCFGISIFSASIPIWHFVAFDFANTSFSPSVDGGGNGFIAYRWIMGQRCVVRGANGGGPNKTFLILVGLEL